MGREMFGATPEGAYRVPIIREESQNVRPSTSEVTRGPSAYEGMVALGENLHGLFRTSYERAKTLMNQQNRREALVIDRTQPELMTQAIIEDTEAGIEEVETGAAEMESHAKVLGERIDGRNAIVTELERFEGEL